MSGDTVFPELTMGLTETLTSAFEAGHVEEWPVEEVTAVLSLCDEARQMLRGWRRSVNKALARGVDVQSFAAAYDPFVDRFAQLVSALAELAREARERTLPTHAAELISHLEEVGQVMEAFRAFLADVLAKMKGPGRSIDWNRVEKGQEAYAKGEMKPFATVPRRGNTG